MTDEQENLDADLTNGEAVTDEPEGENPEGEEEAGNPPEGEADGQEGEGEEGDKADQPEPKASAQPKAEEPETKRWRDEATQSRGHLATALRTLKALRDDGVLDDAALDAAATKAGLDPVQVRSVLNQEPPPANQLQANANRLLQQYGTADKPGELKLALDEAYGEDTQKYFEAYDWLILNDPAEKQALAEVDPRKVASYAIRRGKEVFAEYQELNGGSLIGAFRALKTGKAAVLDDDTPALKPGKPASQSKTRVPLSSGGAAQPKQAAASGGFRSQVLG